MSWSKIKKAINSTLGTNNFKPLDKIVEEGFNKVKEKQDAIGKTANSTLEALTTGVNNYSVKFADSVKNLFAQRLEFENPEADKDDRYVDLAKSGVGLYMIIISDTYHNERFVSFLYYTGIVSSSITYYSTPMKHYPSGKSVFRGKLHQGSDERMAVYKINLSFESEA